MSEPVPPHPTPTAVPWTPEMSTDMPNPGAPQDFDSQPPQIHPAHYQPAPHYQAPQGEYLPAAVPQGYAPQPQMQTAQYPAAPHPQYAPTPQHAPALQPVHLMQQSAPPQMAPAAAFPHTGGQIGAQPQYAQPAPPPLPSALSPQMHLAALGQSEQTAQTPEKSKSLIASLLKRSPKPVQAEADFEANVRPKSIFNKTFVLGAVTGLVIGAFVLPMVLSAVSGSAPEQAQARAGTITEFNPAPAATNGDTFIDNAIATDTP